MSLKRAHGRANTWLLPVFFLGLHQSVLDDSRNRDTILSKMPPKTAKTVQPTIPELEANRSTAAASKGAIDAGTLQAFRDIVKEVIKEEADSLREEIKRSVDPITTVLDECKEKIREHEDDLNNQAARLLEMETRYTALSSKYKKLQEKVDDLENRGRRCNLRLLGIPEDLEAHRAAGKPIEGGRPRPFIICVHYYHEKEQIQRLAREKGRLEYRGKQIFIFPDYSADLNKRRAAFNEVKKMLREKGVRYRLFYPAKLQVSFNGETKMLDSPTAAKDFYASRVVNIFDVALSKFLSYYF
uniref:L1 transposable element RRM domain-containing protein n=1 Tax=Neogobius melanostomus TaxID=47308 RepID=A0A8C6ULY3_9GOBI